MKNTELYKYVSAVNKDDIIVMEFDMTQLTAQQVGQFADMFKKTIDNKFILLPKDRIMFSNSVGKEKCIELLENMIQNLKNV